MITEICADIRNYFTDDANKHFGTFEISGGTFAPLDFLKCGQYFRIVGSTFNDGVYQYPAVNLTDETFDGAIWAMKVPPEFIDLCKEIEEFKANDKPTNLSSESFAGYSYTRLTDKDGAPAGWKTVFSSRLNKWRKI